MSNEHETNERIIKTTYDGGLNLNINRVEVVNDLKKQVFEVTLYWLAFVVFMSLVGFCYGMAYATEGYQLQFDQMPFYIQLILGLQVIVLIWWAWWLVKRTKRLVFMATGISDLGRDVPAT